MLKWSLLLCQQQERKLQHVKYVCRLNKRDGGGNSLHADICGICPSQATTVSVNEPWQVLTMHAAGSEELCVIMQPREELLGARKGVK